MKNKILSFLKSKTFQPIWEKLFHYSKIGMNLWGGASNKYSGEKYALKYAKANAENKDLFILFDVGANYGQYATLVHKVFNQRINMFSFEPSISSYKKFKEVLLKSSFNNNINIFNIGFGEKKEKRVLNSAIEVDDRASLYNVKHMDNIKNIFTEIIELNTIDDFCRENNIGKIDYLKIDVEGHELYVLIGAKKMIAEKKIKYIQFEFGFCNIDSKVFFRDFYNLLSENYNFYRIVSDGLRPIREYSYDLEIFNIANYLAELKNSK